MSMNSKLLLCLGLATFLSNPFLAVSAPGNHELSVEVKGIKNTEGQVLVAIYATEKDWLNIKKAKFVKKLDAKKDQSLVFTFPQLPEGTYSVSVLHDENSNEKMDMNWFPPGPAEGAVVSNEAQPSMVGPPDFNDAKFVIKGDQKLTLPMSYP